MTGLKRPIAPARTSTPTARTKPPSAQRSCSARKSAVVLLLPARASRRLNAEEPRLSPARRSDGIADHRAQNTLEWTKGGDVAGHCTQEPRFQAMGLQLRPDAIRESHGAHEREPHEQQPQAPAEKKAARRGACDEACHRRTRSSCGSAPMRSMTASRKQRDPEPAEQDGGSNRRVVGRHRLQDGSPGEPKQSTERQRRAAPR